MLVAARAVRRRSTPSLRLALRGKQLLTDAPLTRSTAEPLLHIVLFEPQIPPNTGTIGRLSLTSRCRLHLIAPHFSLEDKWLRRAGMDYWPLVDCVEHADWQAYLTDAAPDRVWLYTTRGTRSHWDGEYRRGDHLLFGNEQFGAPAWMHEWMLSQQGESRRVRLPMSPETTGRSINLACTVSVAVYEGLRQIHIADGLPF
jgi:tRNA (cytidine/uridine-2'-O-)-methyltransferase